MISLLKNYDRTRLFSLFAIFSLCLPMGCSIYQSDGRKAIEKNTGNIVTATGFSLKEATRYECRRAHFFPFSLQKELENEKTLSLQERVENPLIASYLIFTRALPTLITTLSTESYFYYCELEIYDSVIGAERLKNVTQLGVQLLERRSSL